MAAEPTARSVARAVPRLSRFALRTPAAAAHRRGHRARLGQPGPESYFRFSYAAAFAVNDVAMVFFFGLMTKEVVEATAPGGVLHPWRRVLLPVVASIGLTLVPALIHVALVGPPRRADARRAWPVTFASDIAVSYLAVRLIFGRAHAAVPFAILLALVSDALGFLAIALSSPTRETRWTMGVGILVAAMVLAGALRRFGSARSGRTWLGPGALSWFALYWSGLHPALALVPIVPFFPHAARDPGFFVDASPDAKDTLSRFEVFWRYPAQAALFLFGLVNAGVTFGSLEQGTWALPLAVLVGKPIGLMIGAGAGRGRRPAPASPHRLARLVAIGLSAAIGLSVGLFFCAASIAPGQIRSEISMGVLLTVAALPLALLASKLLGVGRFATRNLTAARSHTTE